MMKISHNELEYLAAWAREEKSPDPYALPAHQQQVAHKIRGVVLIRLIKAWAREEGRRDEDIFTVGTLRNPTWPWASEEQLAERLTAVAPR